MPDFPIVDTHVHLYDPSVISYGWMAGLPILNARPSSGEYTAAVGTVNVDKLVFVEVDASPGDHMAEARWIADLATRDTRVRGMVASIPLEEGRASEADIAAFASMPLARNVRRLLQGHVNEPGWALKPAFLEGVALLAQYGLGFEICLYHPQMAEAIELVKRSPENMTFVLNHIGKPGIKDGLKEPWATQIREMASLPNVMCKISGVITEADHQHWTYDQVAPYVDHAIASFGFDRVMFGGDWPVVRLAGQYTQWVDVLDRVVASASDEEKRKLYRENAIAYYRL